MKKAIIIGAGPAGSVASLLLARAGGIDVSLIEQHRFPRDKVCGECVSAVGMDVLGRLGLSDALCGMGARTLCRCSLYTTTGASIDLSLPREMCGISRRALDAHLLEAARASGVKVIQPARFEGLARDSSVTVRDLETNELRHLTADYVLVADGKSAVPTGDFGLKAHFAHVDAPGDAIELFGVCGHYGGIAPIEGGRWNIAFSVPAARFQSHRGDLNRLFKEIVGENRALADQMRGSTRVSEWLVSPLPRSRVARDWPARILPIGNAAASIEPIGGEGIGVALRSAELAAECVIDAARRGIEPDTASLRAKYHRLFRLRRIACRAAALAVSSPRLAAVIAPFLHQHDDPLAGLALRAIGKF